MNLMSAAESAKAVSAFAGPIVSVRIGADPFAKVTRYEAQALIATRCAVGVRYKNRLSYLRITVAPSTAMRVISRLAVPGQSSGVTRRKQGRGSKHWVPRPDNADSGRTGSTRVVFAFPAARTHAA